MRYEVHKVVGVQLPGLYMSSQEYISPGSQTGHSFAKRYMAQIEIQENRGSRGLLVTTCIIMILISK